MEVEKGLVFCLSAHCGCTDVDLDLYAIASPAVFCYLMICVRDNKSIAADQQSVASFDRVTKLREGQH